MWALRPVMQALRSVHADSDSHGLLSIYNFSPDKNRWTRTPYTNAIDSSTPSKIRVLTWNVDFMAALADERLKCVLEHIQHVVFKCPNKEAPEPCVLLLQEIEAEVIPVLLSNEWVRAHFQVTPISKWNWPNRAHYGNITLVARGIPVASASSLVFANSHMARNALMVDVLLASPTTPDTEIIGSDGASSAPCPGAGAVMFRIANVHLESLPQGATARPQQLALVAQALVEPGLLGGMVCGDMNAISEADKHTPKEVGLCDAYVGTDDDADGHTWGYQPVCSYPPGRLDKVLYTPGTGFVVEQQQRVGVGLKTANGTWASDHYGLLTSVSITRE